MTSIKVLKDIVPKTDFLEYLIPYCLGNINFWVQNYRGKYLRGIITGDNSSQVIRDMMENVIKELYPETFGDYQSGLVACIRSSTGSINTIPSNQGFKLTFYWSPDGFRYGEEFLTNNDILLVSGIKRFEITPISLHSPSFDVFEINIINKINN